MIEEEKQARVSIGKIKKVCRVLDMLMKVIFVILTICWFFSLGSMLLSIANPNFFSTSSASLMDIVLCVFFGVTIAAMFFVFAGMFSDVAKEESPFTLKVKRLRIIATLLAVYAIIDIAASYNSAFLQLSTINAGYVSTNGSAIMKIDFAPFVASAVVFAFSFVFKYGVLLQEFSDETL